MSERDTPTTTPPDDTSSDQEMRSLPDGGLTEGLPDWLRRPPAWRDLARKAPEAEKSIGEPANKPSLPEPNTSVIDPRTLVDVSDLPEWLQKIAARGEESALESDVSNYRPGQENTTMNNEDQTRDQSAESAERAVAFEPVDKKKWEVPEEETKTFGGGPPKSGASMQMVLTLGAVVLAIILIVIIVTVAL